MKSGRGIYRLCCVKRSHLGSSDTSLEVWLLREGAADPSNDDVGGVVSGSDALLQHLLSDQRGEESWVDGRGEVSQKQLGKRRAHKRLEKRLRYNASWYQRLIGNIRRSQAVKEMVFHQYLPQRRRLLRSCLRCHSGRCPGRGTWSPCHLRVKKHGGC